MENEYHDLPLQRLFINKDWGTMNFGRLENRVHYNLCNETDNLTNKKCPARYSLTPDLKLEPYEESHSLSVWVWKNVPEKFREIVLFHELKEAEYVFADGMGRSDAHKKARVYHLLYAKKFLDEKSFKKFIKWQSQFKCYQIRGGK